MSWEPIYTVDDFWDGPLLGVADFRGTRHIYQRIFDEHEDDWTDRFWLAPIDGDLFALVIERSQIGLRWQKEFRAGRVALDSHLALPQDRARSDELQYLIGNRLTAKSDASVVMRGRFRVADAGQDEWEVEWFT